MGASVCLMTQIVIGKTLDKCQTLQNETVEASRLNNGFDEALRAVLDVRPLLETACSGPVDAGSRVLRSVQLVAIGRTLQGLMKLRTVLMPQTGAALITGYELQNPFHLTRGIYALLKPDSICTESTLLRAHTRQYRSKRLPGHTI